MGLSNETCELVVWSSTSSDEIKEDMARGQKKKEFFSSKASRSWSASSIRLGNLRKFWMNVGKQAHKFWWRGVTIYRSRDLLSMVKCRRMVEQVSSACWSSNQQSLQKKRLGDKHDETMVRVEKEKQIKRGSATPQKLQGWPGSYGQSISHLSCLKSLPKVFGVLWDGSVGRDRTQCWRL